MAEQHVPDERELSAPIAAEEDEAYQTLANECGRRVWVVMDNLIQVRGRTHTDGVLSAVEVKAILMGSITGIAFHVARMKLGFIVPEGSEAPSTPPEMLLLNDLAGQYMHVIEQMRQTDPLAKAMAAPATVEVPDGAVSN